MGKYVFSKGELTVSEESVRGFLNASTSMQQMPGRIEIDTALKNVGPMSINEVKQFRISATSIAFGTGEALPGLIWLLVGLSRVMGSSNFEELGKATQMPSYWWPFVIGTILGSGAAYWAWNHIYVYMAQFSNGGQTMFIPYLKQRDYRVIQEFNAELYALRHPGEELPASMKISPDEASCRTEGKMKTLSVAIASKCLPLARKFVEWCESQTQKKC